MKIITTLEKMSYPTSYEPNMENKVRQEDKSVTGYPNKRKTNCTHQVTKNLNHSRVA